MFNADAVGVKPRRPAKKDKARKKARKVNRGAKE